MTNRITLYTFGLFIHPAEDPENDEFHHLNDLIFADIEQSSGFIARSGYEDEPGPKTWGKVVYPNFYTEKGDGYTPQTLSIWRDLESAFEFTYTGLHARAYRRGREWNVKPEWPPYTLWWIDETYQPNWQEAIDRHAYMHEHGATSKGFSFKQAFDPKDEPYTLKQRIKKIPLS